MSAGLLLFLGIWLVASFSESYAEKYPFFPHSPEEVTRIKKLVGINKANLPWKAEYNAQASTEGKLIEGNRVENYESLKLDGLDFKSSLSKQIIGDTEAHLHKLAAANITLPESFDARDQWPRCASIHHIQNQGGCGSCWAAASVSVMSDRLCISSNYADQQMISLQDLVSCCEYCGGCAGSSNSIFSFIHWKMTGLVTGNSFGTNEGCRPYEVESTCGTPCSVHFYQSKYNPQCNKTCNNMYGKEYKDDVRKGKQYYWLQMPAYNQHPDFKKISDALPVSTIALIKREIMTHGPVVFCTRVTEPFAHYRSGIYTNSQFDFQGNDKLTYGHCMRIIGWGSENGLDFWTISNSWGRQWGDNGFGRLSIDYFAEYAEVLAGLW